MAVINFAHREITATVVYIGAPDAGSSRSVRALHGIVEGQTSELLSFGPDSEPEQTWFFEYLSQDELQELALRIRVYAVPGALTHLAHRRELLGRADAVVFVADARASREAANLDALLDLESALKELGLELAALPVVLQVNHTDAEDARSAHDVAYDLNPYGYPVVASVAHEGKGLLDGHARVVGEIAARIRDNLQGQETAVTLSAMHRDDLLTAQQVVEEHLQAVQIAEERAHRALPRAEYAAMAPAGEIEIAYQPADFAGTRPIHVLGTVIESGDIRLDVIMERAAGGTPRRLQVMLASRPTGAPPTPRHQASRLDTGSEPPQRPITESLPDRIELAVTPAPGSDFPPLWYGIAGLASGILIGLLIGVLSFL